MEEAGDNHLERAEIKKGFKTLIDVDLTEEELNQIMVNVDVDQTGYINFENFLNASIDLSRENFMKYCEKAWSMFFEKKPRNTIEVMEFVEILQN